MQKDITQQLIQRFKIEQQKKDRSGIYAVTQRSLAYNSNKIEGSTLSEEQTASLFDTGYLPKNEDYYRAKDIEEMNGHFLMFNYMLETIEKPLTEDMIKHFHYELKAGVFEDRANGYAVGEYKQRTNVVGVYSTTEPEQVRAEMQRLLEWYAKEEKNLQTLALFHAKYETIHPFQDGNGRTGRIILFRECLFNGMVPLIIKDRERLRYLDGLQEYRKNNSIDMLVELFCEEQEDYKVLIEKFI